MKKLCPKCNCEWEGYYDESPSNHFCPPPQTDEIPYSEWTAGNLLCIRYVINVQERNQL